MGRFKEKAKGLFRRAGARGEIGAATVAVVIALIVILNVIVYALGSKYSWVLYTAPRYEHTIGSSSETFFSDLDQGRDLKIRFCMNEEDLEGDAAYRLVLETARQFADKYDFISVDFINTVVYPDEVSRYKYGAAPQYDEDGKKIKKNNVTKESVVVDAGGEQAESGIYKVDGTWTFTATTARGDNNEIKPVKGYTLDMWDGSAWIRAASGQGDSYTYTVGTSPAKVRLTWNALPSGTVLIVR